MAFGNRMVAQFYEAYEHDPLPIIAISGNHDGEPVDEKATSLEGFHRNFSSSSAMAAAAHADASAAARVQGRHKGG